MSVELPIRVKNISIRLMLYTIIACSPFASTPRICEIRIMVKNPKPAEENFVKIVCKIFRITSAKIRKNAEKFGGIKFFV